MRELLAVDDYLGKHSYYLAGVQLRWKPCSFLQINVKCKNFCWRLEVCNLAMHRVSIVYNAIV